MIKKEWKKIVLGIAIALLFGLLLVTILNFTKNQDDITIENNPVQKEEDEFYNNSLMQEKDIRELLEKTREEFAKFISNIEYYKISEVSKEYTKEDDEKYIVLREDFLNHFKELVTEEFYTVYWNQLTEIVPNENVSLNSRIYQGPINIFDELYSRSTIARINVNEEILILRKATDEKIEATENIKLCEEGSEFCVRDDKYNFVLIKENDVWKIAALI